MLEWLGEQRALVWWMTAGSVVALLASVVVVPIVIVRLPADYFCRDWKGVGLKSKEARRRWGFAVLIARNVLGVTMILMGLAMLVLPGQGLLFVLMGVMASDFPGKFRIERWIISRRGVLKVANRLRARFKRQPLVVDTRPKAERAASPAPDCPPARGA